MKAVTEPIAADARLVYMLAMIIPPVAREVRKDLDQALWRRDRRIRVTARAPSWCHGLYPAISADADDKDAARAHALRLVTEALNELGPAEVVPCSRAQ